MAVPVSGKSPVVVVPSPKTPVTVVPSDKTASPFVKPPINLEVTKRAFVAALEGTLGQQSAADKIEQATFSVVGDTLKIQTNLSAAMLPLFFDDFAQAVMKAVLLERGAAHLNLTFLSATGGVVASVPPKAKAISASFQRLGDSAAKLNKVSDQLTAQIEQIDAALKRLNLGVTAWVTITTTEDEDGNCLIEKLGYVRIGSRWGVALKTTSGMRGDPTPLDETFSAFSDAPRQLRMRAVEHIPKLLDQLSEEAEAMVAKLSPKVDEIGQLNVALQSIGGGMTR